jgi:flagellar P-ring protein precursor FlgI
MGMWASLLLLAGLLAGPAHASRVKDVATVYGVRSNPLVGNGLVVGLNKTGDSTQNQASIRALATRLQALGVTIDDDELKSRNVAMVMVTSSLPPNSRPGSMIDVQVASVGDAKSLEGGILLLTPLFAANGAAVASAQGPLVIGGYSVSTGKSATIKNHPTVGTIPRGATVEIEIPNALDIAHAVSFDWVLSKPDFTNATRLMHAVNTALDGSYAAAVDSGTVRVGVPDAWLGRQAEFIALIEATPVEMDHVAKVVVNERTGTVVIGADISVRPVAIAHGGLTIEVDRQEEIVQPNPLAAGETAVQRNDEIRVDEQSGHLEMIEGTTVGDVVKALNRMGVTPRDLIVILQAMRAAGGIQAEIETL